MSKGAYFGGRKAEDGIIDWSQSALEIHNLVRAVAPPYPGRDDADNGQAHAYPADAGEPKARQPAKLPRLSMSKEGKAYAIAGAAILRVVRFELDGVEMNAAEFAAKYGTEKFEFNR